MIDELNELRRAMIADERRRRTATPMTQPLRRTTRPRSTRTAMRAPWAKTVPADETADVETLERRGADAEAAGGRRRVGRCRSGRRRRTTQIEEEPQPKPDKGRSTKHRRRTKKSDMDWYILKVQSNREESIREALDAARWRSTGWSDYFDEVIVPTEKVTEFKGGKKKVVERKLYPGYIVVHMEINDDTWFVVRETSGHRRFHRRRRQADADAAARSGPHRADRGRRNERRRRSSTSSSRRATG